MDFKKIVLPAFVFVFISSIHAQSHRFTISGRIEGLGSSKMFIIIPDDEAPNGYRRDSIMVENDVFQFTSNIDKLNYVNISPGV
jgi:hypothetical protein